MPPAYRPSKATQQTVGVEQIIDELHSVYLHHADIASADMDRLCINRAMAALQRLAAAERDAKYQDNRGFVVRSGNTSMCLHGVQLVQRGSDGYKACEPCFKFVCSALSQQQDKTP